MLTTNDDDKSSRFKRAPSRLNMKRCFCVYHTKAAKKEKKKKKKMKQPLKEANGGEGFSKALLW